MKKKNLLFTILLFVIIITLTGCTKKALTETEFKDKAVAKNFIVTNIISQYEEYNYIDTALEIRSPEGWQIKFYIYNDDYNLDLQYDAFKNEFEYSKGNYSTQTSTSALNYSNYALTSNEHYMYICKVDNTLIYVNVNDNYKNSVKEFIKEIGY